MPLNATFTGDIIYASVTRPKEQFQAHLITPLPKQEPEVKVGTSFKSIYDAHCDILAMVFQLKRLRNRTIFHFRFVYDRQTTYLSSTTQDEDVGTY